MDFSYTPEQEAFRARLREWLRWTSIEVFGPHYEKLPRSVAGVFDAGDDDSWQRMLEWHRRLNAAGHLALGWPKEWGGGGAGPVEQAIYQDEVLRLGLPLYGANMVAIDRVGPTLILMASDEQRRRYLPKMLTGEEIWCQGYSEPNAGSDLASLETRAVLDGDSFVVNGQKTWTSFGHRAHWQVLLARTDPNAPKHRGISYLLVDMRSPGITVRPLRQMTGDSGFCEVFYDNVCVPKRNLVGDLNAGWQVSIATLMYERLSGGTRYPVDATVAELIALAKAVAFDGRPAMHDDYVRQRVAQLVIEAMCLKLSRYRSLTAALKGRMPGPESSFGKLFATELCLRIAMFADELLGMHGDLESGSLGAIDKGRWAHRTLAARAATIGGGASEIQHNIIGERVLGLPRG